MDPTAAIKKVPKWAWIASGGVVAGSLALRVLKSRSAAASSGTETPTAADAASATDPYGSASYGSAAIVVPPTTYVQGPANDGTGVLDTLGLFVNGIQTTQDLLAGLPGMVAGYMQQGADIYGTGVGAGSGNVLEAFYGLTGGGAPFGPGVTGQQNTGPGSGSAPATPIVAPPATPAPAPTGHVYVSPNPPQISSSSGNACNGEFPLKAANGKCYKETSTYAKDNGKCYHYYWHEWKDGSARTAAKPRTPATGC